MDIPDEMKNLECFPIDRSLHISPGEFHPEALTEPCLSLSTHTALVIHEELPPFATIRRFLLSPVDQHGRDANDLPSSLHGHYSASSLVQGSPPLNFAFVLSPGSS